MENIDIIRQKFQEACAIYATASGHTASYQEGKMVGMVEAVATIKGISWIEADVLLRKVQ